MKGMLGNYGQVWYSPRAITNILSLKNVSNKYRVTYNSWGTGSFEVHKLDNTMRFTRNNTGLYIHDASNNNICLLNTVLGNCEGYSNHDCCAAVKAHRIYKMIGYPSTRDYKNMVEHDLLGDTGVTL